MADNNIPPYPLMFSADQWANRFSPFKGQALPWPSQYMGVPTDARGQPIQSFLDAQSANAAQQAAMPPSTTLNSAPAAATPAGPAWSVAGQSGSSGDPGLDSMLAQRAAPGMLPVMGITGGGPGSNTGITGWGINPQGRGRPAAAAAPQAPRSGIDMSQAYLNALSNPGHVTTPGAIPTALDQSGATLPQNAPPSAQSGVLQQFLQNWQNKGSPTTGAGNYNNAGFFNALRGNV